MRLIAFFLIASFGAAQTRDEVLAAMKKAAQFYREKASKEGGYHFAYAHDLSYGRSESAEGPTQVEVQREGTPRVGMAYLEAYAATGERVFLDYAGAAGMAYVKGQMCSGGWDYLIEFDAEKRKRYAYRADGNCGGRGVTNLDDNVTQSGVRFLMRLDTALEFKDAAIHGAVKFALESLLKAQYPIGAWPQRFSQIPDHAKYPVKKASYPESWPRQWPGENYQTHYTFNDNTIADAIDMMLEAARIYKEPKYLASAERGGQFILLAQMPDPQPAWAQQYDLNMHPAWARVFEPPSVTGGESQGIMRMLFVLYRETGNRKYLEPVPRALEYLKKSILPPQEKPSEARRRIRGPALARFYELRTNRPLYITKGTQVRAQGLGSGRPDGYELSYTDESVITHYGVVTSGADLEAIEADYKRLAAADPATLQRPDVLHGLSPWSERERRRRNDLGSEVKTILAAMDERGAWTEEGVIGKADLVASVFTPGPMVVTVNGRKIVDLKENDTIAIYRGAQPPRERMIRSSRFAENLETLAEYVAGLR
ncbi:MAG: hypothetical protein FJW20_09255 [Acidimicrobiia bacterium]|nr:hypothetical protein [Acidimicrobiia bacterium]